MKDAKHDYVLPLWAHARVLPSVPRPSGGCVDFLPCEACRRHKQEPRRHAASAGSCGQLHALCAVTIRPGRVAATVPHSELVCPLTQRRPPAAAARQPRTLCTSPTPRRPPSGIRSARGDWSPTPLFWQAAAKETARRRTAGQGARCWWLRPPPPKNHPNNHLRSGLGAPRRV